jgi:uncharacterized YccA/Bax inhibitor family protein
VGHLGIIDDVVIFFIRSKSCTTAIDVLHEVATYELLDSHVGFSQPPLYAWGFALGVFVYLVLLVLALFNAH